MAGSIAVCVDWLRAWRPNGPWAILELNPDRDQAMPIAVTFHGLEPLEAYLAQAVGQLNLYFVPNEHAPLTATTRDGRPLPPTTPHKHEITGLTGFFVDLDLPKTGPYAAPTVENFARLKAKIRALDPAPTALVFSGGGYQAFWLFPQPLSLDLPATERAALIGRVEQLGSRLAALLGSDAVQNVNRLMRLPGSVNLPNAAKRARGRTATTATVVEVDWARRWNLYTDVVPGLADELTNDHVGQRGNSDVSNSSDPTTRSSSHCLADLPVRWQKLINTGDASSYGDDRSRLTFALLTMLVKRGWADDEILPFLTDERYAIGAHCRTQAPGAAQRQLRRARDAVEADWERNRFNDIATRSPANIRRALTELGARLSFDTFASRSWVNGVGPLRKLDDDAENALYLGVEERFKFLPDERLFRSVVQGLCREGDFHPVQQYLAELRHDGVERLETWLIRLASAPDTPYVRAVSKLIMTAAVRRVRQPGSQFQEMLVLVNPTQGTGKSSAIEVLAVRPEWYSRSLPLHATEQKVMEQLAGKWLIECAELHGMRRGDIEAIKVLLDRSHDHARPAYGHHVAEPPRQCVFFGTTNSTTFLLDRANRRFWPINVGITDLAGLARERDQLWAEASAIEASGTSIRLDPTIWEEAGVYQEAARHGDPWADVIGGWLDPLVGRIAATDAWRLIGRPEHQRSAADNGRLTEVMAELGWERSKQRIGNRPTNCFVRGDTPEELAREIYAHVDPITNRLVEVSYRASPTAEDLLPRDTANPRTLPF
jgi:hypothetical protein